MKHNISIYEIKTEIREEAAEALAQLTGVTNKTELWALMEDMGLQTSYSSKEDEEEALKALAMRLDVPYRPDSFADWIDGWMDDMQSPTMYDTEDLQVSETGPRVQGSPAVICLKVFKGSECEQDWP